MKKKLIVLQEEASDCGACSLLSIIRYYGGNIALENLRFSSLTTSSGVNAYNLIECAKTYGFDAMGIKTNKIEKKSLPCIAHLNINQSLSHFVALYNITDEYVIMMDPASGKVKIPYKEFTQIFTGVIILIYPKDVIINRQPKNMFHEKMIQILKVNISAIIKIILWNIIFILLSLLTSFYIDILLNAEQKIQVIILFGFIAILKIILLSRIEQNSLTTNYKISQYLIPDFFNHLFHLPLKYIHMKSSGDMLKRANDLELVKELFTQVLITMILNLFLILISLSVLYHCNLIIFWLFLGMFLLYILLSFLLNQNVQRQMDTTIQNQTQYNSFICDIFNGLTSIFHSNSQNYYSNLIKDNLTNYLVAEQNMKSKWVKKETIKNMIISLFEIIINTILILQVSKGTLDIMFVVIINIILNMYISSLEAIYDTIPKMFLQINIKRRVNEFYELEEESSGNKEFSFGNIIIKNVTFSYTPFKTVLKKCNIQIDKGEKVVLKGDSGCGKSTICKLLNKEYVGYQGKITIDQVDLEEIDISSLRNHLTYVSQNEKLFTGTIRDNLILGKNVSSEYLSTITKLCHIDEITNNKPFGIDTFLYDGGNELSGGERQRIILARSLMGEANIIILDEVLSEVNSALEEKIMKSLFSYLKDKTIIYISHKETNQYNTREIYV